MSEIALHLAAAASTKIRKTVLTKQVDGKSQTVTFDIAAALPNRYKQLTADNLSAGFTSCYTDRTVAVSVDGIDYNSTAGTASVVLSIAQGTYYTFHGVLALAVIYV